MNLTIDVRHFLTQRWCPNALKPAESEMESFSDEVREGIFELKRTLFFS